MRPALGATVCLAFLFATAGGAEAVQRYATPTGAGEACTKEAPCGIEQAVNKASTGDEVILGSGSYTLSAEHRLSGAPGVKNLLIHGDPAGAPPRIAASVGGAALDAGVGGDVSYLDLTNEHEEANAIECEEGGSVERAMGTIVGEFSVGILPTQDCVVRNSLARAIGAHSYALYAKVGAVQVSNVTALAAGTGTFGIVASREGLGESPLTVTNTIAAGEQADLASSSGTPPKIVVSHSNFDLIDPVSAALVVDLGGNQSAQPVFVNPTGGDYREAAGSPTIDAGVGDQLGTLDLAGNPRVLGSGPDIGAYEFVPPAGELRSITFKPVTFRAARLGGALVSRRKRAPVGARVIYNLSAPATVVFSAERGFKGRRVGDKCKKVSRANAARKKCTFYKPVKGDFSVAGANSLDNEFGFSGRIGGHALTPGTYKLVGRAGTTLKRGLFHIVK